MLIWLIFSTFVPKSLIYHTKGFIGKTDLNLAAVKIKSSVCEWHRYYKLLQGLMNRYILHICPLNKTTGGSPLADSLLAVVKLPAGIILHHTILCDCHSLKKPSLLLKWDQSQQDSPARDSRLIARLYLKRQPWQLSQFPWFTPLRHTAPKLL